MALPLLLIFTQRYILSNKTKLEALAIALKNHSRRKLMETLKIGVLYDAEVTCVALQDAKAQMIPPREGCWLSFNWNKTATSVQVHRTFDFLISTVMHGL